MWLGVYGLWLFGRSSYAGSHLIRIRGVLRVNIPLSSPACFYAHYCWYPPYDMSLVAWLAVWLADWAPVVIVKRIYGTNDRFTEYGFSNETTTRTRCNYWVTVCMRDYMRSANSFRPCWYLGSFARCLLWRVGLTALALLLLDDFSAPLEGIPCSASNLPSHSSSPSWSLKS